MKKTISLLICLCISINIFLINGICLDEVRIISLENFDSTIFEVSLEKGYEQNNKNGCFCEGKGSLNIDFYEEKDNEEPETVIQFNTPLDLSEQEYFSIDIYTTKDLFVGQIEIGFSSDNSVNKGLSLYKKCNLYKGWNRLVFKDTEISLINKDSADKKGIRKFFIDLHYCEEGVTLTFDNFVSYNYYGYNKLCEENCGRKYGDINCDEILSVDDVLSVLQYSVAKINLEYEKIELADVDRSYEVNATDALMILQAAVGKNSGMKNTVVQKHDYFKSSLNLEPGEKYQVSSMVPVLKVESPSVVCNNIQGSIYDGVNLTCVFTRPETDTENERGIIVKYDNDGNVIKKSVVLDIYHGNNITYVPNKNLYLLSHCQPIYNAYSYVDANTMRVTESGELDAPFFSMAYSPINDLYASAQFSGERLNIWNNNLEVLKTVDVECPDSLSQGVFCDSEHIYFVRSQLNNACAEIRIYDWNCNLEYVIDIPEWSTGNSSAEAEGITVIDGHVYIIARYKGVTVFEVFFKKI